MNPRPSLEDDTKDGECFVERLADTSVSSHTDNSTVASTHGEATASQSTDDTSFRCAQVPAPGIIEAELHDALSRKRKQRPSPMPSPLKLTRSPMAKIRRRLRTGTEQRTGGKSPSPEPTLQRTKRTNPNVQGAKSVDDFRLNDGEELAVQELKEEVNTYLLQKHAVEQEHTFLNIQDYFSVPG